MRQSAILLGTGLCLALLTGCPPTYPKCNNDEQCKEHNEVCVQGQCQECATDANCKEGFTCQANKCVPKPPECEPGSTTCGPGRRCEAGKCVKAECENNAQCGAGRQCQDGLCVARPPGSCDTDADCGADQECRKGTCMAKEVGPQCDWTPVYFEFNEASLTADARQRLSALADCLKSEKGKVTLEGHADERGTEEYNLMLSNRRAASVRKYLLDLGIPAAQLGTTGYGENRPADPGHDEAAWGKNRRVEFQR